MSLYVYDPLGLEQPPPKKGATFTPNGDPVDAVQAARESIDVQALVARLQRCGLGQEPMTMPEIRAAETLINRLMAAAASQVNVQQTIEVRDRRREIDALVEVLLQPGAVQRTDEGAALVRLEPEPRDSSAARADGAGPPEGVDIDQLP